PTGWSPRGRRTVQPSLKSSEPMVEVRQSRPVRWAAEIAEQDETKLANYFKNVKVAVRLEPGFEANADARETVVAAVNMLLRFCPGATVAVGDEAGHVRA